ncbi:MAG: hypothetical protein OXD42_03330 [Rhodospirillaceae bacterium]|nr:hypothetical protein [Rhodospirillaceae bacterium]
MAEQDLEHTVAQRICSFAKLPEGWHFGEGVGATEVAVNSALAINTLLADYQSRKIEAFPCVDGGVVVCGHQGVDVVEIQCDPDGSMHLEHERERELVEERETVSIYDIEAYLGESAWSSSGFSTHNITVKNRVDIIAPHFNRHLPVWVSPCLKHSVESIVADQYVTIFKISTAGVTPPQSSFGGLAQTYFLQNVA